MKDTKISRKVAKKVQDDKSGAGVRLYPFVVDDLTEAEWAAIEAMRRVQQAAATERGNLELDARRMIDEATQALLNGESEAEILSWHESDIASHIVLAAIASHQAIRAYTRLTIKHFREAKKEEAQKQREQGNQQRRRDAEA
jgi:hypothetical protein